MYICINIITLLYMAISKKTLQLCYSYSNNGVININKKIIISIHFNCILINFFFSLIPALKNAAQEFLWK